MSSPSRAPQDRALEEVPASSGRGQHDGEGHEEQHDGIALLERPTEPLAEHDLPEAERIFRVAFGTFLGVPEPETFWSDRDYVYGRWRAPHVAALGAAAGGRLVGSNFATRWGSVGFFGPITVDPALQDRGIGKALLAYLAKLCVDNGWSRLQWAVLDWNTPSIAFYKSLGGVMMNEWTLCRINGSALHALAKAAP